MQYSCARRRLSRVRPAIFIGRALARAAKFMYLPEAAHSGEDRILATWAARGYSRSSCIGFFFLLLL